MKKIKNLVIKANLSHAAFGGWTTSIFVGFGLPLLPYTCTGKRVYSSSVLSEINGLKVGELPKDKISLANFYDWFRGFTDAEGSFNISTVKNKFYSFSFEIKLHIDDIKVLNFIQNTLGIGKVYKYKSSPTCKFMVYKQSEVKKIIVIFSIYSLNSSKSLNYLNWAEAFNIYIEDKASSTELKFKRIEALKAGMNTNRTVWNRTRDINITPYWLLGFVEGDGSFSVNKENFLLNFSIAQTIKDLPLMEAIKNYLNSLNSHFNDAVYLTTYKSKTDSRSDMVNLVATKTEFIHLVLLPFFQNLLWVSKKELDFVDWVSILKIKQLGIHHTEQGVAMILRLIGQMNNNRLSTSSSTLVDRNLLLHDLKIMLDGGSNYILNDKGQTIIKSSGKFFKKGSSIVILILDGEGNILNELKSINACATFLGISHDTVRARLRSGKSIKFNSNLVYVKKKEII